ncbi:MAG: glutamine-hydrolyzing GMP synthase [Candidatus Pacebacteria bacterium]|nr:glutamine-hydrolyzing GMP synthase [Candidatus Paceibacterota bacterium]
MKDPQFVILDLGSQYTEIIGREILALGFKNIILKSKDIENYLKSHQVKGIILSGGSKSVYDSDAPYISPDIFNLGVPILGICFGMQYISYRKDKTSVLGSQKLGKEYGPIEVEIEDSQLFIGLDKKLKVWASHGDIVAKVPEGYKVIAKSENVIEAIENKEENVYAVQFHPEVIETEDNNLILKNFTEKICGAIHDWESKDIIKNIQDEVVKEIGDGIGAIGVSGGVDSTTLAAVLSPVLKEKLFCFFIDTGGMREGEVEEVQEACKQAGINLHIIDAKKEFLENLKEVIDAEEKRRKFKEVYAPIFKKVIKENGITHIMQGTLATDLIESGHKGMAATIKSHHNVGLDFGIQELMPFQKLFKHEVRAIARNIGLPKAISERKPFPGPGLYVRVVGTEINEGILNKLRTADKIVNDILIKEPFYGGISQVVVAILGSKTVGVQGDGRSYEYPVVVRCVSTSDFMTVRGFEIPSEIRKKIISEVTKHGFNRVFFDETPKPPATTELE